MRSLHTIKHKPSRKNTKKALRFVYNRYDRQASISCLYKLSGLPELDIRRKISRLKLLYNIVNGKIPLRFENYMQYNTASPTRNKHDKAIIVPQTKKDSSNFYFLPRTINEWNS
ncbi:unnamed protein product [Ixodes hexagonus]